MTLCIFLKQIWVKSISRMLWAHFDTWCHLKKACLLVDMLSSQCETEIWSSYNWLVDLPTCLIVLFREIVLGRNMNILEKQLVDSPLQYLAHVCLPFNLGSPLHEILCLRFLDRRLIAKRITGSWLSNVCIWKCLIILYYSVPFKSAVKQLNISSFTLVHNISKEHLS